MDVANLTLLVCPPARPANRLLTCSSSRKFCRDCIWVRDVKLFLGSSVVSSLVSAAPFLSSGCNGRGGSAMTVSGRSPGKFRVPGGRLRFGRAAGEMNSLSDEGRMLFERPESMLFGEAL